MARPDRNERITAAGLADVLLAGTRASLPEFALLALSATDGTLNGDSALHRSGRLRMKTGNRDDVSALPAKQRRVGRTMSPIMLNHPGSTTAGGGVPASP